MSLLVHGAAPEVLEVVRAEAGLMGGAFSATQDLADGPGFLECRGFLDPLPFFVDGTAFEHLVMIGTETHGRGFGLCAAPHPAGFGLGLGRSYRNKSLSLGRDASAHELLIMVGAETFARGRVGT